MVTGELKSRIDSLWEVFWTGGLTNPLDVIEQMTYLMFIHDLDDSDNLRAREAAMLGLPYESVFAQDVRIGDRTVDGSQLKWSVFHDFPAGKMYSTVQEWVFPFIKNLHGDKESAYSKYMGDAIFKVPTPLIWTRSSRPWTESMSRWRSSMRQIPGATCTSTCSPGSRPRESTASSARLVTSSA